MAPVVTEFSRPNFDIFTKTGRRVDRMYLGRNVNRLPHDWEVTAWPLVSAAVVYRQTDRHSHSIRIRNTAFQRHQWLRERIPVLR